MLSTLSKNANEKPCDTIDTLIGSTAEFKGNITFSGGLRIDGKVKGNITAKGGGNSVLILSEHAEVHGNVTAPHMVINGEIKGNVHCSERIELQPQAEIIGDVRYKLIGIALGAAIHGNLIRESGGYTERGVVTKLKPAAAPRDRTP